TTQAATISTDMASGDRFRAMTGYGRRTLALIGFPTEPVAGVGNPTGVGRGSPTNLGAGRRITTVAGSSMPVHGAGGRVPPMQVIAQCGLRPTFRSLDLASAVEIGTPGFVLVTTPSG